MEKKKPNYPNIVIVILTYNQYSLTKSCIQTLLEVKTPPFQIIVVDNASSDNTPGNIRKDFGEKIHIIENKNNCGFAGGNNVGIRYALSEGADYILLLNNDTLVDTNFLQPLIDVFTNYPNAGVVTPKILFYSQEGEKRIWAAGGEINWLIGVARNRGYRKLDHGQYDRPGVVDYSTGCCLLASKRVFEQIGLLNENYFLYFEDTEWCMRAKMAGYEIRYEPTSQISHVAGGSSREFSQSKEGSTNPYIYYYITRNNLWLIAQYARGIIRVCAYVGFLIRHLLFYSLIFCTLRRWKKLRNLWLGTFDGLKKAPSV